MRISDWSSDVCSSDLVDLVKSRSEQWYQEFRLQSSFAGPVNFIVGANYLNFKIDEDYYVFNNLFTALARTAVGTGNQGGVVLDCTEVPSCAYVDPNPLSAINGQGHNYFRSRHIAKRSEEHTSELQSLMRI